MIANVNNMDNTAVLGGTSAVEEKNAQKAVNIVASPAATSPAANVTSEYQADVVSISKDGNIDFALYNYLDKGGDASEALSESAKGEKRFKPRPNFSGMGITRYNQMKSEIERSFADDPDLKTKYLRELDKTLKDYINLQAKLAEALSNKKDTNEAEEKTENESEEEKKLKAIFNSGSNEIKAIIQKVLGDTESALPEELSKAVDSFFIDYYRQKTGASKKVNIFNREVREDPRTKEIWNSVRLRIDGEE